MNVRVMDDTKCLFVIWLKDFPVKSIPCHQIVSLSRRRRWDARMREWIDDRQVKIMVDGQDEYGRPECVPVYSELSIWDWNIVSDWFDSLHEELV